MISYLLNYNDCIKLLLLVKAAALASANYCFNLLISIFKDSKFPEESSLIEALFLINFTLLANFKVDKVS